MRAPTAELPTIEPSGGTSMARPVRINVDAEPSAFGAAPAQALQHLAAVGEQAGNEMFRTAMMRQDLINETAANQGLNVVETNHANYLHDPKTGFLTKRGQDAITGYAQATQDLNKMTADARAALPNDATRRMFDTQALRSTRYAIMQAGAHADQETKSWIQQGAQGRIETVINNGALNWNDPKQVDYNLGRIAVEVQSKGQLEGTPPEKIAADTTHYQSAFLMSVGHQALAHDVTAASAILDKYRGQMDAAHVASLDQAVQSKSYTELARSIALESRLHANAERDMHEGQATNFAQFYSQSIAPNGTPPGAGTISEAVRLQKKSLPSRLPRSTTPPRARSA